MPARYQSYGEPSGSGRIVFVILLVVSLALVTVYSREGDGGVIHSIQNGVMGLTGQVGRVGTPVGAATETLSDSIDNVTADESTLTGLREQNAELRRLLANADEYRQEAERLQGLLNMKQSSGVTGPVAHIIGRSTSAWDQSVTIDLGKDDGVESGMTVMGASGVIGQVVRTSAHTATVRLLSDPNSGAAVKVQSSRADGIVRGSLTGLLYLEDVDEDQIPAVGDVIVTSGLGGSYSSGLIVGTVVSVGKSATNATGSIIVSPNDDASVIEEVIVVTDAPDVAATWAEEEKKKAEEEAAAAQEAASATSVEYYDGSYALDDGTTYYYDEAGGYYYYYE